MKKKEIIKQLTVTKEFTTNNAAKEILHKTLEFISKKA
jgi:hypothetical protein